MSIADVSRVGLLLLSAALLACDGRGGGPTGSKPDDRAVRYYLTMHGAMGSDSVVGIRGDGEIAGTVTTGVPATEALHLLRGMCPLGDGTYLLVNAWKEETRVLRFGAPDSDGKTPFIGVVIRGGEANPSLVHTYSVAVAPDGSIYCSNQDTDTVTRYAGVGAPAPGTPLPSPPALAHLEGIDPGVFVPSAKSHKDGLDDVRGIAFGPDGLLYVADRGRGKVEGYDTESGKRERTLAHEKDGLRHPIQVAFSADGAYAFISDDDANCVWRVDLAAREVREFVRRGSGGLHLPSALLVDGDRLVVGSRGSREVLAFSLADGSPLSPPIAKGLSDGPEFVIRTVSTAPRANGP